VGGDIRGLVPGYRRVDILDQLVIFDMMQVGSAVYTWYLDLKTPRQELIQKDGFQYSSKEYKKWKRSKRIMKKWSFLIYRHNNSNKRNERSYIKRRIASRNIWSLQRKCRTQKTRHTELKNLMEWCLALSLIWWFVATDKTSHNCTWTTKIPRPLKCQNFLRLDKKDIKLSFQKAGSQNNLMKTKAEWPRENEATDTGYQCNWKLFDIEKITDLKTSLLKALYLKKHSIMNWYIIFKSLANNYNEPVNQLDVNLMKVCSCKWKTTNHNEHVLR